MIIQNKEIMMDFPEDFVKSIAIDPTRPFLGPWKITLKPYILKSFMGTHHIFMNKLIKY